MCALAGTQPGTPPGFSPGGAHSPVTPSPLPPHSWLVTEPAAFDAGRTDWRG